MCSGKHFQRQITSVLAAAICLAGACTKLASAQATNVATTTLNDQEIAFDIAVVDLARLRQLGVDFQTKPFVPVPHELVASLEANQAFLANLSHCTIEPGQTFTLTVHDTANPANSERVALTTEAPSIDPRQPVAGVRYVLTPGRVTDGKVHLEVAARMTKSGEAGPPNQLPELSVAEAMTGGRMVFDQTHLIALDLQQAQPWAKNATCLLVTPRRAGNKNLLTIQEKPQNAMSQSQVECINTAVIPRNNTQ